MSSNKFNRVVLIPKPRAVGYSVTFSDETVFKKVLDTSSSLENDIRRNELFIDYSVRDTIKFQHISYAIKLRMRKIRIDHCKI